MKTIELTGTTSAGGTATITHTDFVYGTLEKIEVDYIDGTSSADLAFTSEGVVSESILAVTDVGTADIIYYPRGLGNKIADAGAFTNCAIPLWISGKPQVSITSGGSATSYRFLFYVTDE